MYYARIDPCVLILCLFAVLRRYACVRRCPVVSVCARVVWALYYMCGLFVGEWVVCATREGRRRRKRGLHQRREKGFICEQNSRGEQGGINTLSSRRLRRRADAARVRRNLSARAQHFVGWQALLMRQHGIRCHLQEGHQKPFKATRPLVRPLE